MAWTDPAGHVFATGEVVTAATLNTYVRLNLTDLDRRTTITSALVGAGEATASTSYTNLTTSGPANTVTIGTTGKCLVTMYVNFTNSGANLTYMSVAISGATTVAAADTIAIAGAPIVAGSGQAWGASFLVPSLNSGSTTFTAKYRVAAGTGTYSNRNLSVTPLGS